MAQEHYPYCRWDLYPRGIVGFRRRRARLALEVNVNIFMAQTSFTEMKQRLKK